MGKAALETQQGSASLLGQRVDASDSPRWPIPRGLGRGERLPGPQHQGEGQGRGSGKGGMSPNLDDCVHTSWQHSHVFFTCLRNRLFISQPGEIRVSRPLLFPLSHFPQGATARVLRGAGRGVRRLVPSARAGG